MLDWKLSEGNAFDSLSILDVKLSKSPRDKYEEIRQQHEFYCELIEGQIGNEKFWEVVKSIEYVKLLDINKKIFEITENARHYKINFSAPIALNKERFRLKSKIQEKYFSGSLNEVKI